MRIVFNDIFYNSEYAKDSAALPGRMESIMKSVKENKNYIIESSSPASEKSLLLCHTQSYINQIKENKLLFQLASESAGAAIKAAGNALNEVPTFACNRPPGHHAYSDMAWGHCFFNNMVIALKSIQNFENMNIFLLDFDAHTGDGTRDLLKDYKNVAIMNPTAATPDEYIKEIKKRTKELGKIDLIAVCAGFDSYEKDLGKKLRTFDYFHIGSLLSDLAKKNGHKRKFAVLEGGYYLPDLGKNVVSFCDGFLK